MTAPKSVLIAIKAELLRPIELFLLPPAVYLVELIEGRVFRRDIEWKVCSYSFLAASNASISL